MAQLSPSTTHNRSEEAVRSFLSSAGEGAAGEGICRLLLQFENRWSRVAEMLVALLEEG